MKVSKAKAKAKSAASRVKAKLTEAPATRRLKKAVAKKKTSTSTKASTKPAAASNPVAKSIAQKKAAARKKAKAPGAPLAGTSTGPRHTHRSATGRRLGPGGISGGV